MKGSSLTTFPDTGLDDSAPELRPEFETSSLSVGAVGVLDDDDATVDPALEIKGIAQEWLQRFNAAIATGDRPLLETLVHPRGNHRDLLTFGWTFGVVTGAEAVAESLVARAQGVNFAMRGEPSLGRLGPLGETINFFTEFETPVATGRGFVRLLSCDNAHRAIAILTSLGELKAFPERTRIEKVRAKGTGVEVPSRGLRNWRDEREETRSFSDRDPEVVIVGGGMAGLMAAARLGQLNVPTLIVDRFPRVGDVWRNRYHSLRLHNQICTNHFPYLPFPDTWPIYLPKDKLAGWMEFYAEAMELNVWSNTEFLDGEYDEQAQRWFVRVRGDDGSERVLRPSHVIMAVGLSGIAHIPHFPGIENFAGPVVHTGHYTNDMEVEGKKVVVVGAGNSAHDIAQDFSLRGADVTMLQRSPVTIVSLEPSSIRVHEMYIENEGRIPLVDLDLMAASIPLAFMAELQEPLNRLMAEDDRDMLDKLRAIGFMIDESGYFLKALTTQSGYYLNVGASDLLIEGKIKLRSGVEVESLTAHQVVLSDDSSVDADILVMATGYQPLQEAARKLFGNKIADRVGSIGGLGDDGELRNIYGPTPQPGFYVVAGGLLGCRAYTHYTARLIKAEIEGLAPRGRQRSTK